MNEGLRRGRNYIIGSEEPPQIRHDTDRNPIVNSQEAFEAEVDRKVEEWYGRVMPPYQRDLVKRIAKGQPVDMARPFIRRICTQSAKEIVAVITAGQTAE